MTRKEARLGGTGLCLAVILAVIGYYKVHFVWGAFFAEVRTMEVRRVLLATGLIYASVCLRAVRWKLLLLRSAKEVGAVQLVGAQFIGFSCVAAFGSLGDLVRPYLIARKLGSSLSSQIALYTIERVFDLASAVLIFTMSLFLGHNSLRLGQRAIFFHVGLVSLIAFLAILSTGLVLARWGEVIAAGVDRHAAARPFAAAFSGRLRSFREGLLTIRSSSDFIMVSAGSLAIWGLVGMAYEQVVHAFIATPQLRTLDFAHVTVLLAASIGGAFVQLPVVGWFTQIAATATTMHTLFQVPTEAATACGAVLLGVTFIFLIPAGILFGRLENLSLFRLVQRTENLQPEASGITDAVVPNNVPPYRPRPESDTQ